MHEVWAWFTTQNTLGRHKNIGTLKHQHLYYTMPMFKSVDVWTLAANIWMGVADKNVRLYAPAKSLLYIRHNVILNNLILSFLTILALSFWCSDWAVSQWHFEINAINQNFSSLRHLCILFNFYLFNKVKQFLTWVEIFFLQSKTQFYFSYLNISYNNDLKSAVPNDCLWDIKCCNIAT